MNGAAESYPDAGLLEGWVADILFGSRILNIKL